MLAKSCIVLILAAALFAPLTSVAQPLPQDFLTAAEASKIRNAGSTNARISLFLDFAADRLQRFERELKTKGTGPLRASFLNDLLDSFSSCVDEASSRIDGAMSSGADVRGGIRDFRKRVPQFLAELKKIKAKGVDLNLYKDSLSDAAADLRGDLSDVEKDAKQLQFNAPSKGGRRGRR